MNHEYDLKQETREIQPIQAKDRASPTTEVPLLLSQFVAQLNTQFGTDFDEQDTALCIRAIEEQLGEREDLVACLQVENPEDAVFRFVQALKEVMQSIGEAYYRLYKRLKDDRNFEEHFVLWMFKRYELQNTD